MCVCVPWCHPCRTWPFDVAEYSTASCVDVGWRMRNICACIFDVYARVWGRTGCTQPALRAHECRHSHVSVCRLRTGSVLNPAYSRIMIHSHSLTHKLIESNPNEWRRQCRRCWRWRLWRLWRLWRQRRHGERTASLVSIATLYSWRLIVHLNSYSYMTVELQRMK